MTDTNTMQSILAKLAALEAANAKLATDNAKLIEQANKARGVTVRVTESGGIGIFGGRLRKFGASFYATEWHTILSQTGPCWPRSSSLTHNRPRLTKPFSLGLF